jgi:hypothetical protein
VAAKLNATYTAHFKASSTGASLSLQALVRKNHLAPRASSPTVAQMTQVVSEARLAFSRELAARKIQALARGFLTRCAMRAFFQQQKEDAKQQAMKLQLEDQLNMMAGA